MKRCPACGLELPPLAKFCARCGTAQPETVAGTRYPTWLLVLFGIAVPLTAAGALVYAVIGADPNTPGSGGIDAGSLRTFAGALAIGLGGLSALHAASLVGLLRSREWARTAATVACVIWGLTCLGLPLAVLALNAIWSRGATESRPA